MFNVNWSDKNQNNEFTLENIEKFNEKIKNLKITEKDVQKYFLLQDLERAIENKQITKIIVYNWKQKS